MKHTIIYSSITGHSKKLAKAIANSLQLPIYKINKKLKLTDVDTLFIIGGIYSSQSHPKVLAFVKQLEPKQVKQVALLTSSASNQVGQTKVHEILKQKHIHVVDEFRCFGSFLWFSFRHPKPAEIKDAIAYVANIIKKTNK